MRNDSDVCPDYHEISERDYYRAVQGLYDMMHMKKGTRRSMESMKRQKSNFRYVYGKRRKRDQ